MNKTALVIGALLTSAIVAIWGLQPPAQTAIAETQSGSARSAAVPTHSEAALPQQKTVLAPTVPSAVPNTKNAASDSADDTQQRIYAEDFERLPKEQQKEMMPDSRDAEPLSLPYKTPRTPTARQLAWFELVQQHYQWPFNELFIVSDSTLQGSATVREHQAFWQLEETTRSAQHKTAFLRAIRQYPAVSSIQMTHLNCRGNSCEVLGMAPDSSDVEAFVTYLKNPALAGYFDSWYVMHKVQQQIAFHLFLTLHEAI